MKTAIHPNWYPQALVACVCGNTFTTGSTLPEIHVGVCSSCHPFYTGQMRYVDTAGRVDRFREKFAAAQAAGEKVPKKERRAAKRREIIEKELSRPDTLEEIRKG